MVPGRKFSSTTSAEASRRRRIAWPSGAFMLSVRLFLLRFTERKYVASPLTKGGQPRVSSPLPGSSILMTSAPMSPSDIAQNGPASTRVRSMTRTPWSGGRAAPAAFARRLGAADLRERALVFATGPPVPHALDDALADGSDPLAACAGALPEQARPVGEADMREVEHGVDRLHRDVRADPHALGRGAVAEQPRAAFELDEGDVQRGAEALGRRVQRGERDHLANGRQHRRFHLDRMVRTDAGRGHHETATARAARRAQVGHQREASTSVTQLFVARPPIDWARPTRACTCRPSARPRSCQHSSTSCEMPVAASGWPRALSPPDGFTGRRPPMAVSPSRVARPALPGGTRPVSSSETSSNGAKASWISATSTRSGPKPAILYAASAAACVARNEVRSGR